MRLGIVADEFFDGRVGRMGGFGWAARQVARLFNSQPDLGVRVIFLSARSHAGELDCDVHGTPLVFRGRGVEYREWLERRTPDLLLTVDFRPKYWPILKVLDSIPIVVWVRDPRPDDVQEKVKTLRIPQDCSPPRGIETIDCRSLANLAKSSIKEGRPVLFATPAPSLAGCLNGAYGVSGVDCAFLPNIVETSNNPVSKSETPRVIFLGRLDPIKRPWLFVELARSFPAVEFLVLGQAHFHGAGTWTPADVPPNVRFLGHVDGAEKRQLVSSAWVLVNTSIHEALATSFLEALALETPLLSFTNQEGLVSRFGILADWVGGDGIAGLPALAAGLKQLLANERLRVLLGTEGRHFVNRTHSAARFVQAFNGLCARAGIHRHVTQGGGVHAGAVRAPLA